MKMYKVYEHENGHIEAVKVGWSWPGFFFIYYWAAIKRLWTLTGVLLMATLVIDIIDDAAIFNLDDADTSLITVLYFAIYLCIMIFLGVQGNKLREENLIQTNYKFIGTKNAPNPSAAITLSLPPES